MKRIQALLLGVCLLLMGSLSNRALAQTCPAAPGTAVPYVLIDSAYQVGTVAAGSTYASFCYVNPTSTKITGLQFRVWYDKNAFGGVGSAVQTTEVLVKLHMAGLEYEGKGSEETSAQMMFIQLNDDQIPFDKTTLSTALKKAIADAVKKMPAVKPIEQN